MLHAPLGMDPEQKDAKILQNINYMARVNGSSTSMTNYTYNKILYSNQHKL